MKHLAAEMLLGATIRMIGWELRMSCIRKKPYEKPMIAIEDYTTGSLTGSPELIQQILDDCKRTETEINVCPAEGMPCCMRRAGCRG